MNRTQEVSRLIPPFLLALGTAGLVFLVFGMLERASGPQTSSPRCAGPEEHRSFSSREALQAELIAAWEKESLPQLAQLAHCAFYIQRAGGLSAGIQDPERALPLILASLRGRRWARHGRERKNAYFLPLDTRGFAPVHQLIFRKLEKGGRWYFGGFAAADPQLYEALIAGSEVAEEIL